MNHIHGFYFRKIIGSRGKIVIMGFEKLKAKWEKDRKVRFARSEILMHLVKDRGKPLFKKYGVQKVVIFGSVANNLCDENSDIDIYVEPLSAKTYWAFRRELEEAVDSTIDLYTDSDDPIFIGKIISRGEVIYHEL